MKILKSDRNYNVRELYYFTKNATVEKMSDVKGEVLEMDGYVLYDDATEDNDKEKKILCVKTKDGRYYGTNSATFIRAFMEIVELFETCEDDQFTAFGVVPGTNAKNGREFITCCLA